MSANEHDIEQLEAYLDGELSADESAALAGRLASNHALSNSLEELRADRMVRRAIFAAGEPGGIATAALNDRIFAATDQYESVVGQSRRMRWFGAAAACLVAGFAGGYIIHGEGAATALPDQTNTPAVAIARPVSEVQNPFNASRQWIGTTKSPTALAGFSSRPVMDASGRIVSDRLVSDEQGFHDFLNSGGANVSDRPHAPTIRFAADEKESPSDSR